MYNTHIMSAGASHERESSLIANAEILGGCFTVVLLGFVLAALEGGLELVTAGSGTAVMTARQSPHGSHGHSSH